MRAAIVAVGSELLSTDRLDTNSLRVTELLERHGVELVAKSVVGDDEGAIAREIGLRLDEADLVIVSGGLGPTADDVTREAAAAALGRRLTEDPEVWKTIERRFASFGRVPTANNRRQARVVEGARVLRNPRGSAPGLRIDDGPRAVFLLPGVPHELDGMLAADVEPWLESRSGGTALEYAVLKVASRAESEVDGWLEPAYADFGRERITVLAGVGEIKVRLAATGPEAERRARLDSMRARVRGLLGDALYGEGAETTLEQVVGERLAERGSTLAVAESCTGGLLAERLTRVPGSSRYFLGGAVVYANQVKSGILGVPAALIEEHGAVSGPVARAMAEGCRRAFGADFALAVTGIAGPDGATPGKPVGTVFQAVAGPEGTEQRRLRFPGDRERIRAYAAQAALEILRRRLLGIGGTLWTEERAVSDAS
jgi:nicotinamide-nucleotide amidase